MAEGAVSERPTGLRDLTNCRNWSTDARGEGRELSCCQAKQPVQHVKKLLIRTFTRITSHLPHLPRLSPSTSSKAKARSSLLGRVKWIVSTKRWNGMEAVWMWLTRKTVPLEFCVTWETWTGKILQCRLGLIYPKAECTEETVQALAATVPVTPKEWVQ